MRPMLIGHSQGGDPGGQDPATSSPAQFGDSDRRLESAHRYGRGPHDDRRPADRPRAAGGRASRVAYASAVGAGGAALLPAQPVGHDRPAVRRFPTRSRNSPAMRSRSISSHGRCRALRRQRFPAERHAPTCATSRCPPATTTSSIPVIQHLARRPRRARLDQRVPPGRQGDGSAAWRGAATRCCGPPTSGTASRSTGASRRSG